MSSEASRGQSEHRDTVTVTGRRAGGRAGHQIFYYIETCRLISVLQYKLGCSDLLSSVFIMFIVLLCPVINPFKPKLFTFIVCISGIQF